MDLTDINEINNLDQKDIAYDIHTEPVIKRYYHIQRLNKPIALLTSFKTITDIRSCLAVTHKDQTVIIDGTITFKNQHIIACIEQIEQANSLDPLLALWNNFQYFKSINNKHYLREFLMLTFIVYKIFFTKETDKLNAQEKIRISLKEITELYNNINNLHIEELLHAIDSCADTLEKILTAYDMKTESTWIHNKIQFLRTYWWVTPVTIVVGSMVHKILFGGK
jgi:hypothetical protein